ncbi:FHA domain-containing protein [bacterium]|nr:FHA domain-containing protein [bacterium]
MAISLQFVTGPLKGKKLAFEREKEIIIGRQDDCEITIKDPGISGEHCGIYLEDNTYVLEDFDSTNGTFVNTTKVKPDIELKTGDTIFLGASRIVVTISFGASKPQPKQQVKSAPVVPMEESTNIHQSLDDLDDMEDDTNVRKVKRKTSFVSKLTDPDFYLDAKDKYMELPIGKKLTFTIIPLVLIIMLFVVFSKSNNNDDGGGLFGPSDDSEKVYPLEKSMKKLYGNFKSSKGAKDFSHPIKARFSFNYEEGTKIELYYTVVSIEYLDEVIIKVNDVEIGKVPLTTNETNKASQKLSIPIETLKANDNLLEFINTRNLGSDKKNERWGIMLTKLDVRILPKPDLQQAKENYQLAEKFFNQKKIYRGNLFKAITYYEKSIYFMELMQNKPDFFNDAHEKMKMIQQELWAIYKDAIYMAKREIDFGNYAKAEEHVFRILEEIPDDADSRYIHASKFLNFLSGKVKRK